MMRSHYLGAFTRVPEDAKIFRSCKVLQRMWNKFCSKQKKITKLYKVYYITPTPKYIRKLVSFIGQNCQALCPFCVCVSKSCLFCVWCLCLKVQKWTPTDTKVTFHLPTPPENFLVSNEWWPKSDFFTPVLWHWFFPSNNDNDNNNGLYFHKDRV